ARPWGAPGPRFVSRFLRLGPALAEPEATLAGIGLDFDLLVEGFEEQLGVETTGRIMTVALRAVAEHLCGEPVKGIMEAGPSDPDFCVPAYEADEFRRSLPTGDPPAGIRITCDGFRERFRASIAALHEAREEPFAPDEEVARLRSEVESLTREVVAWRGAGAVHAPPRDFEATGARSGVPRVPFTAQHRGIWKPGES